MSARIAPEPVSIAVSPAAQFAPKQSQQVTRPVESAGASSSDYSGNNAFGRKLSDGDKARPGDRPPGKDPSMLPQALFDAALIASEYKPSTAPVEPKDKPEPVKNEPSIAEAERAAAQFAIEIAARETQARQSVSERELKAVDPQNTERASQRAETSAT